MGQFVQCLWGRVDEIPLSWDREFVWVWRGGRRGDIKLYICDADAPYTLQNIEDYSARHKKKTVRFEARDIRMRGGCACVRSARGIHFGTGCLSEVIALTRRTLSRV